MDSVAPPGLDQAPSLAQEVYNRPAKPDTPEKAGRRLLPRWRKMTWAIVMWSVVMLIWAIAGGAHAD